MRLEAKNKAANQVAAGKNIPTDSPAEFFSPCLSAWAGALGSQLKPSWPKLAARSRESLLRA
jgi:hypothetical protein